MKKQLSSNTVLALTIMAFLLVGCNTKTGLQENKEEFKQIGSVSYRVEAAPEWSNLFMRNSGWFGGDGIFAIPLNNGSTAGEVKNMFLFSDTMIGEINNGELQPGFSMVHNSVAYLVGTEPDPNKMRFAWKKKADGSPATFFTPQTDDAEEEDYYWLGDGFLNQALNNIYIFAYRVRNTGEGAFPFKVVGNPLIVIPTGSEPPFENQRQIETPLYIEGAPDSFGSFGAGIFVNTSAAGAPNPDGYVYIYGVKGADKQLIAARVKPENFEDFGSWKYWDGDGWSSDIDSVQAITNRVSNELSVSPIGHGKFALIFTVNGVGPKVGMRIGKSPVGPFGPIEVIWETDINDKDSSFFAYNAKGHPSISSPGELLVSYNVNSFNFFEKIKEHPHLYRPRFIRIVFKQQ